jgi:hypothetical protein
MHGFVFPVTATAFGVPIVGHILARTIAIAGILLTVFPFRLGFFQPLTVTLALILLCGAGDGCRSVSRSTPHTGLRRHSLIRANQFETTRLR